MKSVCVILLGLLAGCCCPCGSGKVVADRIGVCSWSFQKPMKEVAAEMSANDVKGIHLALGPFIAPDERHGAAEGAEAWAFVKERVKSGKWRLFSTMIDFIGQDYTTLETIRKTGGIVPDANWEANKALVTKGAALTRELGCRYMSGHAGFLDENDPVAYAKFVQRVEWIRDECAKYDVMFILESGQETAADLAEFMKKVPGIGINFDPANMILYGKGCPVDAVEILLPWICQVHIKDALFTKTPGTWGEEIRWGDGQVQAREFLERLDELGYRGNFAVEREGGSSRPADIATAVRRLKGKR